MIKNKNLFRKIGLIALTVALSFATVFAIIPKNDVYADETSYSYVYNGSKFYTNSCDVANGGAVYDWLIPRLCSFSFVLDNFVETQDGITHHYPRFDVNVNFYMCPNEMYNKNSTLLDVYTDIFSGTGHGYAVDSSQVETYNFLNIPCVSKNFGINRYFYCCYYYNSITFNANVQSVEFGSYFNNDFLNELDETFKVQINGASDNPNGDLFTYNYIKFYDNNNNYLIFVYYCSSDCFEQYRVYNLPSSYGNDINYLNGYNNGYNTGYSIGYNDGVSSAGNYSFLGLIGAVIDAPIKAFTGLFNFEILGTNISAFITAMLTLAIVIVVIRFAMGKF